MRVSLLNVSVSVSCSLNLSSEMQFNQWRRIDSSWEQFLSPGLQTITSIELVSAEAYLCLPLLGSLEDQLMLHEIRTLWSSLQTPLLGLFLVCGRVGGDRVCPLQWLEGARGAGGMCACIMPLAADLQWPVLQLKLQPSCGSFHYLMSATSGRFPRRS